MSKFVREGRYIVFKISHLDEEQLELLERVQRELPTLRECVVVESDWPEYEKVWEMIEDRVQPKIICAHNKTHYSQRYGEQVCSNCGESLQE